MTDRCLIEVEEADDNVADDPAANRTEPIAASSCVRLAQDVEPEGCFPLPSHAAGADVFAGERPFAEVAGNHFPRR